MSNPARAGLQGSNNRNLNLYGGSSASGFSPNYMPPRHGILSPSSNNLPRQGVAQGNIRSNG